jgi:hypothetical protein
MDIYQYRKETLGKIENMSDENFVKLLQSVGVDCYMKTNDLKEQLKGWRHFILFAKRNYGDITIDNLKVIHSEVCGLEIWQSNLIDIYGILIDIIDILNIDMTKLMKELFDARYIRPYLLQDIEDEIIFLLNQIAIAEIPEKVLGKVDQDIKNKLL